MNNENDEKLNDLPVESEQDEAEEIEFLPDEEGNSVADLAAKFKKLKEKYKESEKERVEYLSNWQRERADFLNYKKDENERTTRSINQARERVILDLLPALDSYDMAFANKDAWEKVDKNWRMGVEYIHQQILKAIAEYGVAPIETKLGDKIDPELHQAIEVVETDDESKDETISSITQSGYKINDRILRPARVNVFGFKN